MKFDTKLLNVPECEGDSNHPTAVPLYQTVTFAATDLEHPTQYNYTRIANPTRDALEKHIAEIESAQYALSYASGVNAISAVLDLLRVGDEVIAGKDIYGGSYRVFTQILPARGIKFTQVDTGDIAAVKQAITASTKLIWLETPSNPHLLISDIAKIARLAKDHSILVAVDNSLLVYLQNPLALGADITMISATKHYSGHSDVTAGVILINDETLAQQFRAQQMNYGNALAPFDAWLLLRGIKTLSIRLQREQQSALTVVAFLERHPAVKAVFYPRQGQAHYEIHRAQAKGHGCVISFAVADGAAAKTVVHAVKVFHIAASFGCVHSFISIPKLMSHAAVPAAAAPADNLIRISIGLEDPEDLIADLKQALDILKTIEI